jgi:hypothetical protein
VKENCAVRISVARYIPAVMESGCSASPVQSGFGTPPHQATLRPLMVDTPPINGVTVGSESLTFGSVAIRMAAAISAAISAALGFAGGGRRGSGSLITLAVSMDS